MKSGKLFIIQILMLMLLPGALTAANGLTAEISAGYYNNAIGMNETILKDGEPGAPMEHCGNLRGMFKAITPQSQFKSLPSDIVKSSTDTDGMSAVDLSVNLRAVFLEFLYARAGFNYDIVIGAKQEIVFADDAAEKINLKAAEYNIPANLQNFPDTLNGSRAAQEWNGGLWSVPVIIGINIPIDEGKYNFYVGMGTFYYSAFWSVSMTVPEGMVMLSAKGTEEDYGPAEKDREVKFENSGIGVTWQFGADAEVAGGLFLFAEYNFSAGGGMSKGASLEDSPSLTAGLGVDTIYYPVDATKGVIKGGIRYRFLDF